jgi:hypothetical protein
MAVERADLLTDHDVHAQRGMVAGEIAGANGPGDLIVIGESEHVDAPGGRQDQILRGLRAVAPPGVHMEIGTPQRRSRLRLHLRS